MSFSGIQMRRLLSVRSAKRSPLAVEDAAGAGDAGALEAAVIGQISDGAVVEPDHLGDVDGRILDVLVLAELPVDRNEAVELQAVQRLDLGRDGVRIVHGDLDEVVEGRSIRHRTPCAYARSRRA